MSPASRFLSCYLALSLVPPWGALTRAAQGAPQESRPGVLTPAESRRKTREGLERFYRVLSDAARQIPRDSFDPQGVIEKVGRDPVRLFEWVRDSTHWVPYQGALRGSRGVLMDRVGSSLDRSLCLAEILWSAGSKVRLARGELPAERAQSIRESIRALPQDWLPPELSAPADSEASANALASGLGIDAGRARAAIDGVLVRGARAAEDAARIVAEETPLLAAALGKAAASSADEARELAALRDHWWVEVEEKGAWKALDVLLPGAEPGVALAAAKATIPFDARSGKLPLAAEDCHEVEIRVVIEQTTRAGRREATALKLAIRPAEILGQKIVLSHDPLKWPERLTFADADAKRFHEAVLAQREWLPVLEVGRAREAQMAFNDQGTLIPKPDAKAAAQVGRGVGRALGGFAGALGGGENEKTGDAAWLTAEWIEYEIRSPGKPARTMRREVFDWIGPQTRAAAAPAVPDNDEVRRLDRSLILLGDTEILILPCHLSPRFTEHQLVQGLLEKRAQALAVCADEKVRWPEEAYQRITALISPASPLAALAQARIDVSRFAGDIYLDRPNVLSLHSRLHLPTGKGPLLAEGFDIVANEVAVRAGAAADPYLVRLEQGVLDTSVEGLILGTLESARNTAALRDRSRRQGDDWIAVRDARTAPWSEIQVPGDARARIEADVLAGYAVLVPKHAIPVGGEPVIAWWRLDPRSGDVLGIGERGHGSDEVEYTMTQEEINAFYAKMHRDTLTAMARGDTSLGFGLKGVGLGLAAGIFIGLMIGAAMFAGSPPPPPPSPYKKG